MEREFVIMESNDVLVEHNCTLGFVQDPACTRLKGLQLIRAAGNQWGHADGRQKSVQVGDAQFEREWVTTRDRDVPVEQALSAGIRQVLSNCPQGESWYFGDGWARCTFDAFLDAKNLAKFMRHMDEVVGAARN
jgi:hypothetical protein